MPRRASPDPELPVLARREDAMRAGLTSDQIRQRVRSGAWVRVRRGAYLPRPEGALAGLDEFARVRVEHVHRAIAAAERNQGTVICDGTAGIAHGMPALVVPARVQLGVVAGRWTGTRSGIDFRRREFAEDEVLHGRVPMATPERAWLDMACTGSLAEALVAGDGGLRSGVLGTGDLDEMLLRTEGRRGRVRAERARSLLDPVRESPLESASFAYFVSHRIPLPNCQVVVHAADGRFLARVDFLWPDQGVVGECDGRMKYRTPDDLYAEKRREDALRREGYRVVRWGMEDLRGRALADRVHRVLR